MIRLRSIRILPLLVLFAAAACGGGEDDLEDEALEMEMEQDAGRSTEPWREPWVSPEDSAAAARAADAHSDSVRRRAEREAGVRRADDARPAAPPAGSSVAARYRSCLAQVAQADSAMRPRLAAACENLRRQPPTDAPPPS